MTVTGLTRRWAALLCLTLVWLGAAQAVNIHPWTTTLPEMDFKEFDKVVKDPKASYSDGILVYPVGEVMYLFTPPETLGNRTLEQVAQQLTRTLAGPGAVVGQANPMTVASGQTALVNVVFKNPTGAKEKQVYAFFSAQGQWGAMIALVQPAASEDEAVEAEIGETLAQTAFRPTALAELVSPRSTSRLSAVPWPTLRADRAVAALAKVSGPQALKLGLNPELTPLPDRFDCYLQSGKNEQRRPMTPTPDARISFTANSYDYNDGARQLTGRWNKVPGKSQIALQGGLQDEQASVIWRDVGQVVVLAGPAGPLSCFQAGPSADLHRLGRQKAYVSGEEWTCADGNGGAKVKLNLAQSSYTHSRGSGRMIASYLAGNATDVEGKLYFQQGPFHGLSGALDEDEAGNRTLTLTRTLEFGGAFHTERYSATIALCSARTQPKPTPLYGPQKAPATGQKGGLSGLYLIPRTYSYMSGMLLLQGMNWAVTLFTPDGYLKDDLELVGGQLPDCTRTLPNGLPLCQRYELKGTAMRVQDEEGVWENKKFSKEGTTLKIGEDFAYPLPPLKGPLNGAYTSDTLEGANMGVSTGTVNSLSNVIQFTSGGQFVWRSSSGSSFSVGAGGFSTDMIASGGSSRSQTTQGTYRIGQHWIDFKDADGTQSRRLAFTLPPALAKPWDDLVGAVNISGTWYTPVGK